MDKIKLGIIGTGKLAQALIEATDKTSEFQITAIYSSRTDMPEFTNDLCKLNQADIIVDCSAQGFDERTEQIKKPIILATTQEYTKHTNTPTLILPNASVSWNLIHIMLDKLNQMGQYEFTITDIHHKHKRDAISGSARKLINALEGSNSKINVNSHRISEYAGFHALIAVSEDEMIKIDHQAFSRKLFGEGLAQAAKWLFVKTSQQKSMQYIAYTAKDWLEL